MPYEPALAAMSVVSLQRGPRFPTVPQDECVFPPQRPLGLPPSVEVQRPAVSLRETWVGEEVGAEEYDRRRTSGSLGGSSPDVRS